MSIESMSAVKQVARWRLGDIAERKHDRKLFRVVGFILSPAVVFHEIVPEGAPAQEMVEVGDCLNERNGLRHYAREAE
jgi:hypothetical protein